MKKQFTVKEKKENKKMYKEFKNRDKNTDREFITVGIEMGLRKKDTRSSVDRLKLATIYCKQNNIIYKHNLKLNMITVKDKDMTVIPMVLKDLSKQVMKFQTIKNRNGKLINEIIFYF